MRSLLFACAASAASAALLGSTAAARAASTDPLGAAVRHFIVAFDKGDLAAVKSSFVTTGVSIVDEVPPHVWIGSGALPAWLAALAASDRANGVTDGVVFSGTPTREVSDGTHGYAIVPATYRYKQRGVATRETAQMAFALRKVGGRWLIAGFTWAGTAPKAGS